jgi:glycosyltransferase involved in cell wall biosynthesis
MHILYLHQYFVPPDGAGGTRSYEMARRLVRAGHRVTLVTSSAGFPDSYGEIRGIRSFVLGGIDLRVLHVPYSNRFSYPRRMLAFLLFSLKTILQVLKVQDVDLVFASSTPLTIVIPGLAAKIRHRCPMVFEVRDLWPELPIAVGALRNPVLIGLARQMEKLAYRSSARVVALSPGMAAGVARAGYPAAQIATIPNSCDVELFRDNSGRNDFLRKHPQFISGRLVSYAGTFGLINGVWYLAEIAAAMRTIDPEIKFVAIGQGREEEQIIQRARELQVLGKNFWVLPPMEKKFMPQVLGASTVALSLVIDLPAIWNNSANKFFDALAAGCPIVINHRGWQADFIENTGAGLVIPARDPEKAARLLYSFMQDEERLNLARQAAAEAADGEFNRDRLANQLERVLCEAASKSKGG